MKFFEAMKVCFFLVSLACLFGGQWNRDWRRFPQATSAIECYQCNSEYDPRCGDPFDPYSLGKVNCSLKPHLEHLPNNDPILCRKTSQKIFGKIRVVRDCGYLTSDNDNKGCVKKSGTFEVQNFFCSCTNDLCNGSTSMVQHSSVIGVSVLLALIATRRLQ